MSDAGLYILYMTRPTQDQGADKKRRNICTVDNFTKKCMGSGSSAKPLLAKANLCNVADI